MHFEITHVDNSEYFEDPSLVYVKDRNGVLHFPPGYGQRNGLATEATKDPIAILHNPTCAMKIDSCRESPCNLYQICKNFIAKNLHLVESLVDFPDVIGNDLFVEALQIQVFHKKPKYLNIFCVAYRSLVLKHLALRHSTVMINENLKFLQCFNSLTKLDLGHCRLGDSHEYLQWIGKMKRHVMKHVLQTLWACAEACTYDCTPLSEKLDYWIDNLSVNQENIAKNPTMYLLNLKCLCLKDNSLTDIGISSWTLPHRLLNSGPELLRTLDLSCNPRITDLSAKHLVKFGHLKSLNLSGTGTTIASGIKRITRLTHLKLVSFIPEFSKEVFTKTKGWATPFISELFERCKDPKPDKNRDINSYRKPFYQSSGTKLRETKIDTSKVNLVNYPVILLQSEELVLPDTLRNVDTGFSKKRNKERICADNEPMSLTVKRQKTTTSEKNTKNVKEKHLLDTGEERGEGDINLLENYLKYSS